jgi:hypothetical protein
LTVTKQIRRNAVSDFGTTINSGKLANSQEIFLGSFAVATFFTSHDFLPSQIDASISVQAG